MNPLLIIAIITGIALAFAGLMFGIAYLMERRTKNDNPAEIAKEEEHGEEEQHNTEVAE